jgi:hypothetical protein
LKRVIGAVKYLLGLLALDALVVGTVLVVGLLHVLALGGEDELDVARAGHVS